MLPVVAAAGVLSSWVRGAFFGLHPIGTLPVMYHLSLAYLAGWLLHLLVVVVPERRRAHAILHALRGNIMLR